MKSLLCELQRVPEFLRWRDPSLLLLLAVRELFRPIAYWYVFDIFETDLRRPLPLPYATEAFRVAIYEGDQDLQKAAEDLASLDDLSAFDIETRLRRGDVVAVAYAGNRVVGSSWLTFSSGMDLAFETSWILGAREALRYRSFVRPEWRGRAIQSLLNHALNTYAREHGLDRTLGGISVLNSQSLSLAKHYRRSPAMRLWIFHLRGLNWTYRRATGAPLESRFAVAAGFPERKLVRER